MTRTRSSGAIAAVFALLTGAAPSPIAAQLPQGKTVGYSQLQAFFPTIPDWTRGEATGDDVTVGMSISNAQVTYTKGDSSVVLDITDTAMNQLVVGQVAAMIKSVNIEQPANGYRKASTVAGFPAIEEWDADTKSAELTVIVAGRFIVKANANDVSDIKPARAVIDAVDLKKLAALK